MQDIIVFIVLNKLEYFLQFSMVKMAVTMQKSVG